MARRHGSPSGAAPDNGAVAVEPCAGGRASFDHVERREAQHPPSQRGGAPGAGLITPLPNGVRTGPIARASIRGPRKPPGASRRSIPFLGRGKRDTGVARAVKEQGRQTLAKVRTSIGMEATRVPYFARTCPTKGTWLSQPVGLGPD